jgi:hypothetical protein
MKVASEFQFTVGGFPEVSVIPPILEYELPEIPTESQLDASGSGSANGVLADLPDVRPPFIPKRKPNG